MKKKIAKVCLVLMLGLILIANCSFAVSGRVTGSNVRIREKADSKSIEVSVATRNEVVDVIGEEGNWYKVNFENVTGYMSKDYVDTDYSSENSSSLQPSETTTPVTTPEPEIEEPSKDENITSQTEELPVQNTVETPEPSETENPVVEENTNTTEYQKDQEITFDETTELKYLPSFTSRKSGETSKNSTYKVKAVLNNWVKVENDSNVGWVLKTKIKV